MPSKKSIYDQMMSRLKDLRKRKEVASKKERKTPPIPPTINNYRDNIPMATKPRNIMPTVCENQISPNEGMPAINGKSGAELVKKAIKKIGKEEKAKPEDAAIKQIVRKKTKEDV